MRNLILAVCLLGFAPGCRDADADQNPYRRLAQAHCFSGPGRSSAGFIALNSSFHGNIPVYGEVLFEAYVPDTDAGNTEFAIGSTTQPFGATIGRNDGGVVSVLQRTAAGDRSHENILFCTTP